MKTIRLDMTNIETVRAAHIYIRYRMDFPAYYGCNLDALHDMLTQTAEPTRLVLCGMDRAGGEVKRWIPAFLRVAEDAARENPALSLVTE